MVILFSILDSAPIIEGGKELSLLRLHLLVASGDRAITNTSRKQIMITQNSANLADAFFRA